MKFSLRLYLACIEHSCQNWSDFIVIVKQFIGSNRVYDKHLMFIIILLRMYCLQDKENTHKKWWSKKVWDGIYKELLFSEDKVAGCMMGLGKINMKDN